MTLLIIGICYNPGDEVESYVRSVREYLKPDQATIIIADNSSTEVSRLAGPLSRYENVKLVHYPDNPGYYPAANRALRDYTNGCPIPPWTVVCNTDMQLQTAILDQLSERFDPSQPLVVAPSIRIGSTGRAQNPFMLRQPSIRSLRIRKAAFSHPLTYRWFRLLVRLRRRIQKDRSAPTSVIHPIYAPHGSFVVFSRGYFENGGTLDYPLPLYGEEIFVAETCRAIGADVVFVSDIEVQHDEHVATGLLSYKRISRAMRDAMEMAVQLQAQGGSRTI